MVTGTALASVREGFERRRALPPHLRRRQAYGRQACPLPEGEGAAVAAARLLKPRQEDGRSAEWNSGILQSATLRYAGNMDAAR